MAVSCTFHRYVCWLYQADDGHFKPCIPDTSSYIECSYSTRCPKHKIKGTLYEIDFNKMMQTQTSTGTERRVQRTPVNLPSSPPLTGYWEYDEGGGKYACYGIQATIDIELAFISRRQPTVDLSTTAANIPYTVDIQNYTQTRHGYHTVRNVRRVSLAPHSLQQYLIDRSSFGSGPVLTGHSATTTTTSTGKKATRRKCSHTSMPTTGAIGTASHSVGSSTSPFTSPATTLLTTRSLSPPKKKPAPLKGGGRNTGSTTTTTRSKGSMPSSSKSPKTKNKQAKKTSSSVKTRTTTDKHYVYDKYVQRVSTLKDGEDGPCPICMSELSEFSGFEEEVGLPVPSSGSSTSLFSSTPDLCKLKRCGHMLHRACLIMYMKNNAKSDGLICPTCKKIHGVKTGDMPNGTMTDIIRSYSLPGHSGYNTIEITYNFTPGIQNGKRYQANGFPRTCYLPNSPRGQKVLQLLKIAWKRRLTFTIGTSVTTGASDTIVWNEIHHKTEAHGNATGHGYPDDNYLDNVLAELSAQGVEEGQDSDSEEEDL